MQNTIFFLCCVVLMSPGTETSHAGPPDPLPERIGATRIHGQDAFDSDSIRHDGPEQWRWLSMPYSRLVLNPSLITERSTPLCDLLALHVGYYHGAHPERMQALASIRVLDAQASETTTQRWRHTLDLDGAWAAPDGDWAFQGVTPSVAHGRAMITVAEGGDPWGHAAYTVAPPFHARSGFIRVHVPEATGAWALKIGHDDLPVDAYIQHDTQRTGTYTYDLSQVDGWRGRDAFDLKFFAVGNGSRAALASLELELRDDDPDLGRAASVSTCWHPWQLTFEAAYNAPAVTIEGSDFFYDENTVVRMFDIASHAADAVALRIEGRPYADAARIVHAENVLSLEQHARAYALAIAQKTNNVYRKPDAFTLEQDDFQWRLTVPVQPGNTRLALTVAFASGEDAAALARDRAAAERDIEARRAERKRTWDALLANVPAPTRFGVSGIDAKGVTPDEHRRAYYAAWTFLIQNTLPPMPENDYPYPQTPTGKPSLWAEGASRARASAAWESFFAQQLLVFVDPDAAWDAFDGMMSQVDADGWLDGEVLPSRKAQTAWILYAHTGDAARLEKLYPPISRYLRWREKNPRWIYKEHDNPHQRDSNFVDSLLLDLQFMERIADVLGHDRAEWQNMTERVTKNYLQWFFSNDHEHPVQYYYKDTGQRDPGHATWVCSGLYLDNLPDEADEALLQLFRSMYNPNQDLAGLDFYKHPIGSMIAHGLRQRGLTDEANGYIQAILRDIIRATRFSENYSYNPLRSWGVEDSIFGAATIIEFTLLQNGYAGSRGQGSGVRE